MIPNLNRDHITRGNGTELPHELVSPQLDLIKRPHDISAHIENGRAPPVFQQRFLPRLEQRIIVLPSLHREPLALKLYARF